MCNCKHKSDRYIFIDVLKFALDKGEEGFTQKEFSAWVKANRLHMSESIEAHRFINSMFEKTIYESGDRYTLTPEAYFNYLDYISIQEARSNANCAFLMSIIAILISCASLLYTVTNPIKLSSDTTVNISQESLNSLSKVIKK